MYGNTYVILDTTWSMNTQSTPTTPLFTLSEKYKKRIVYFLDQITWWPIRSSKSILATSVGLGKTEYHIDIVLSTEVEPSWIYKRDNELVMPNADISSRTSSGMTT